MDRKGIAGVAVAVIILVVWQYYSIRLQPPRPSSAVVADSATPRPAQPSVTPALVASATTDQTAHLAPEETAPEQILTATTAAVNYAFTNLGGGIGTATLLRHLAENGNYVALNQSRWAPIGALSDTPGAHERLPYHVTISPAGDKVICERTGADQVRIVKTFSLPKQGSGEDEYLVDLDIGFTNAGSKPLQSDGWWLYTGGAAAIHLNDQSTYTGFDWYRNGRATAIDVNWFSPSSIFGIVQTRVAHSAYDPGDLGGGIQWAGVTNQYFTSLITASGTGATRVWATRSLLSPEGEARPRYGIQGALGLPPFRLAPGQSLDMQFAVYVGPKEYRLLKTLGDSQTDIMHFGTFRIVSLFLLNAMNGLKGILGNYVAAILVLTLCIKLILWFPQNWATQSMKRMQALQPKMTELREKYKDDPTRMNQELMKLYKDYGVNPFGGCWPMLIQIPIFFGFFRMLGQTVELRGAGFLWVHDLSQPDTVAHVLGFPVNVLPLCMAVTMIWQMSLTPKGGDPVQQRISMFIPLIFVYFCYTFASALALYYTVQNLFSVGQLYITRNQKVAPLRKAAPPPRGKRR